MPPTATLRDLRLDLAAVLWPTACVGCGMADRDACLACLSEVRSLEVPDPRDVGVPCFARGPYAGALRAFLVALKHEGRTGLARELGAQLRLPLAAALACVHGPRAPVMVTMPSRRARTRQRGYRPVDLLLARALRGWRVRGWRVRALRLRGLRATRGRTGQVGLGPRARAENAHRIAVPRAARGALAGREVILIDDVLTTGASVTAAREALSAAGAVVVAVVVLCTVERGNGEETTSSSPGWQQHDPVE